MQYFDAYVPLVHEAPRPDPGLGAPKPGPDLVWGGLCCVSVEPVFGLYLRLYLSLKALLLGTRLNTSHTQPKHRDVYPEKKK